MVIECGLDRLNSALRKARLNPDSPLTAETAALVDEIYLKGRLVTNANGQEDAGLPLAVRIVSVSKESGATHAVTAVFTTGSLEEAKTLARRMQMEAEKLKCLLPPETGQFFIDTLKQNGGSVIAALDLCREKGILRILYPLAVYDALRAYLPYYMGDVSGKAHEISQDASKMFLKTVPCSERVIL